MHTEIFLARVIAAATVGAAAPVAAQIPHDVMLGDWARFRANVVAFVEVMPEDGFDFRPTPEVRSFAEQIEHVVTASVGMVATGVEGHADPPAFGSRQVYLTHKDALLVFVNEAFDYVEQAIRSRSTADLARDGRLFEQVTLPRWRILEIAREHGIWTLGSVVPYVRLNGLEPPGYTLFPGVG